MTALVLVDGGWADHAAADHAVHLLAGAVTGLRGADAVVASHVLAAPEGRRVCLVLTAPVAAVAAALPEARVAALRTVRGPGPEADVLAAHAARASGRLVSFPGEPGLRGPRTAGRIVAESSVEAVVGLAGTEIADDTEVDLGDFVRPVWRSGRCELVVQRARGGLVPFEVRHQIACCSDH